MLLAYAGAFTSMLIKEWAQSAGVLMLIASGLVFYLVASRTERARAQA